jgi:hypothetical protein
VSVVRDPVPPLLVLTHTEIVSISDVASQPDAPLVGFGGLYDLTQSVDIVDRLIDVGSAHEPTLTGSAVRTRAS